MKEQCSIGGGQMSGAPCIARPFGSSQASKYYAVQNCVGLAGRERGRGPPMWRPLCPPRPGHVPKKHRQVMGCCSTLPIPPANWPMHDTPLCGRSRPASQPRMARPATAEAGQTRRSCPTCVVSRHCSPQQPSTLALLPCWGQLLALALCSAGRHAKEERLPLCCRLVPRHVQCHAALLTPACGRDQNNRQGSGGCQGWAGANGWTGWRVQLPPVPSQKGPRICSHVTSSAEASFARSRGVGSLTL